nr:MAG TPA: hypothetical protein [Bacteriophage sp.]DAO29848.1 MAG TPA: hypothetical protein [Bacteriophage sp.]
MRGLLVIVRSIDKKLYDNKTEIQNRTKLY